MARGDPLTPYQKGVVRRYYEHRENLAHQRLCEIVSELYLCASEKEAARLWRAAAAALKNAGAPRARAERCVASRDLEDLARLVARLF